IKARQQIGVVLQRGALQRLARLAARTLRHRRHKPVAGVAVEIGKAPISLRRHPADQHPQPIEDGDDRHFMSVAVPRRRVELQAPQEQLRRLSPVSPSRITEPAVVSKNKTPVKREVAAVAARAMTVEMPDLIGPYGPCRYPKGRPDGGDKIGCRGSRHRSLQRRKQCESQHSLFGITSQCLREVRQDVVDQDAQARRIQELEATRINAFTRPLQFADRLKDARHVFHIDRYDQPWAAQAAAEVPADPPSRRSRRCARGR
ncbi:hypothetical protein KXV85_000824, partial [Aspergillus fumigatus]